MQISEIPISTMLNSLPLDKVCFPHYEVKNNYFNAKFEYVVHKYDSKSLCCQYMVFLSQLQGHIWVKLTNFDTLTL